MKHVHSTSPISESSQRRMKDQLRKVRGRAYLTPTAQQAQWEAPAADESLANTMHHDRRQRHDNDDFMLSEDSSL